MPRYYFEYEDKELQLVKNGHVTASSYRQAEQVVMDEYGLKKDEFMLQLVN